MNKIRKKIAPRSIKGRLILWMAVFFVPIFLILAVCVRFITRSYERQMQAYVQQMITPFAAEIDAVLNSAIRYVAGKTVDVSVMEETNQEEKLAAMERIKALGNEISEELSVQDGIDAVFLWNGKKIWFVQNYNRSYAKNRSASIRLKETWEKDTGNNVMFQDGYQSFEVDGTYYLFLAMDVEGGRVGCWFSEDSLFENLREANLSGLEDVMFQDIQGQVLHTDTQEGGEEQYFVSEQAMESAPFSIVAHWNREVIFAPFHNLVRVVLLCLFSAVTLFAAYLFSVQKSVIRPLGRLVEGIGQVDKEKLGEIELDRKDPIEVQGVFDALNEMMREVKNLKIRVYEEQIAEQETKLQLYQLQLRPHFFLNVLNNIVSFARSKDYKMVQKMTLFLAGHCRYILYHTWYVALEEELEYTQNYISMQSIQSGKENGYVMDVEEEAMSGKIPILCVQIFVENSLKYAGSIKEEIEISVRGGKRKEGNEEKLWIMIDDTGRGFSEEQITKFQAEYSETVPQEKDHGIGIANVRQRLKILYGDHAKILFSNNQQGGAHIEMEMPFWEKEGREKNER